VPVTRRSRTVGAEPAVVWQTVADPHQLPRWWPRVERVEGVDGRGFTQVLRSDKGAIVRADFRFGQKHKPRVVVWSQDLEGTPFARLLARSDTHVLLEPDGVAGRSTRVEVRLDQKLQGISRFGGFLVRRAARKQIDTALDALVGLHEDGDGALPSPPHQP
jgi:carbon monoxide dehydrogenase subunit G